MLKREVGSYHLDPQTSKSAPAMSSSRSSPGNHADGVFLEVFLSPKRKLATRSTSSKKCSTAIQHISTHYMDHISSPTSSPRDSNERSSNSSFDKSGQNSNGFSVEIPFDITCDGEHSSGRYASRSTTRSQSIQSAIDYPTPSSSSSSALNNNQSLLQRVIESAGKGKDLSDIMPLTSSSPESSPDNRTVARRKCNFDGSPMDRDSDSTKRSSKHGRRIGVKCSNFGGDSDEDEETKSSNSGMSKNSKLMSRCYPARSSSSKNSDDDRQGSNESDSNYFDGRFSSMPLERKLPLSRSLLSPAYEDYSHNGSRISSPSENTMNMEKLNCNASRHDESRNEESFPTYDATNRDRTKRIPENSDLKGRTFLEISSSEPSCIRKIGLGKVVHGTPFSNFSSPTVTKRNNSSNIFMDEEDRNDIDDSHNFPGSWANDTDLSEYNYSNSFVMSTPPAELRDLGTPVRLYRILYNLCRML